MYSRLLPSVSTISFLTVTNVVAQNSSGAETRREFWMSRGYGVGNLAWVVSFSRVGSVALGSLKK
jgi:hypothetical protein